MMDAGKVVCIAQNKSVHTRDLLGSLGLPHLDEDVAELFTLPLSPQVSSQLQKDKCKLVEELIINTLLKMAEAWPLTVILRPLVSHTLQLDLQPVK